MQQPGQASSSAASAGGQSNATDAIGTDASLTANQPNATQAIGQPPSSQVQATANAAAVQAVALQFQHDVAQATANAGKVSAQTDPTAGSATSADAKQVLASHPTAASTLFSGTTLQSDAANPAPSKVIPFRVSSTNFGASSGTNVRGELHDKLDLQQQRNQRSGRDKEHPPRTPQTDRRTTASRAMMQQSTRKRSTRLRDRPTPRPLRRLPSRPAPAAPNAGTQSASGTSTTDSTPSHAAEARNLPAEPANTSLPAGSSGINSARLIQSMNETEMRVGMRSSEFGDISIRTMVTQQQMQAQISVDHSELVSALSAHIPAVQAKLGADYGLHASIEVSQGGASFSNNQGQSSQKDYKPFTPSAQFDSSAPTVVEADRVVSRPVAASAVAEGSRLDIRA